MPLLWLRWKTCLKYTVAPMTKTIPLFAWMKSRSGFFPTSAKDSAPKRMAFNMRTTSISATAQQVFSFLRNLWPDGDMPTLRKADCSGLGKANAERLEIHYTPKHGSWLDIAEIELSALGRQCIADNRIPDLPSLRALLKPWAAARNIAQKGVDWHFTTVDARSKLKHLYPIIFRIYRVLDKIFSLCKFESTMKIMAASSSSSRTIAGIVFRPASSQARFRRCPERIS